MKNFKFIQKEVTQKEINIKAEDEIEAVDLFIEIQEKTDILDYNNNLGKSREYELTIEESEIETDEETNEYFDENDEYLDDIEDMEKEDNSSKK